MSRTDSDKLGSDAVSPHQASEIAPAGPGIIKDAVAVALRHFRLLAVYTASLTALMWALTKLNEPLERLFGGQRWVLIAVAVMPLVMALVFETVPSWRRRRRERRLRDQGVRGQLQRQGYFRITPYEENSVDRENYARADEAHLDVLAWLRSTEQSILFLTGLSGTGKSSLLAAYVLPELRTQSRPVCPIVVPRYDPLQGLRRELLKPGVVWKKPPAEIQDVQTLIEKACEHLHPARLLLVFDQFEEFLIVREHEPQRVQAIQDLLRSLHDPRIDNLTILLVVRSDYVGKLHGLHLQVGLPPLRQNDNWKEIGPFSEREAREFLRKSGLKIGPGLMDDIFREISEIEETEGLVRPITLNIMGTILARTAVSEAPNLPTKRASGRLVLAYLRQSIRSTGVEEMARRILRCMITVAGTKQPQSVPDLARETAFHQDAVAGCLLSLGNQGLVRRIEEQANVWEISHDFVARLLTHVLATWRTSLSGKVRLWLVPAALLVWAIVYFAVPAMTPEPRWWERISDQDIKTPDSRGDYQLHKAVRHEDVADRHSAAKRFLDRGADVNARDRGGRTALHVAAESGDAEVVRLLLARGAAVDVKDPKGITPLHLAVGNGHTAIVEVLLQRNANINAKIDADPKIDDTAYLIYNKTSLHLAAIRGDTRVLEVLLNKGADVTAEDGLGFTPLHDAAGHGRAEMIPILLKFNAGREAKTKFGDAPLGLTAREGHPEAAKALLALGASVMSSNQEGRTPLHEAASAGKTELIALLLAHKPEITEAMDNTGGTPLHSAVLKGHLEAVQVLLNRNADIEARNNFGAAPLGLAANQGHAKLVELLLDRGANVMSSDQQGRTPLHDAAFGGQPEVIPILISHNADREARDENGNTPLHWAASNDHPTVVEVLLEKSANIEAKNNGDRTSLHMAASGGSEKVVEVLLKRDANVMARDQHGRTPLHEAASIGQAEVIPMLLSKQADIHAKDEYGNTPLHLAAQKNQVNAAEVLLARNASLKAQSEDGHTPLHCAAHEGYTSVLKTLLAHEPEIEARDAKGNTPLHLAAEKGRLRSAEALLAAGANRNATNTQGQTPLDLANTARNTKMIDLLHKSDERPH